MPQDACSIFSEAVVIRRTAEGCEEALAPMSNENIRYSDDGTTLLSCKTESDVCVVRDGCRTIGYKAFMYQTSLKRIVLPSSVQTLEPFALSCTDLEEFTAPNALAKIGDKAFYQCQKLRDVHLNSGLASIGDGAFMRTGLARLDVPATVRHMGRNFAIDTPLICGGAHATMRIDPLNPYLKEDEQGGLYRITNKGLVLISMLSAATEHRVLEETVEIAPNAYSPSSSVESVVLPEGLRRIGKRAFSRCRALRHVLFPESLESIDDEAFYLSGLEELYLSARFSHLGVRALVTGDSHMSATLRSVRVHPACRKFYTASGLLCERTANGTSFVVLYFGTNPHVTVPPEAMRIGPYAFVAGEPIRTLHLHKGMRTLHPHSFTNKHGIDLMRLDLDEEECGRDYLEIRYPPDSFFRPNLAEVFINGKVDARTLCECSDRATFFMRDTLGRTQRMLDRLSCPQFLSDSARKNFTESLTRNLADTCVVFARRGYLTGFDQLVKLGFIDADNFSDIVDRVSALSDAAVTGYLLTLKRRCFGGRRLDFSL